MILHSQSQEKTVTKRNENNRQSPDSFEPSHHIEQRQITQPALELSHADERSDSESNHRLDQPQNRLPPISVSLIQGGEQRISGEIRRIGSRVMFVQTQDQERFPENAHLQVLFQLPGQAKEYQLWGRVIQNADDGLELVMDVLEPTTRDGLEALEKFAEQD
ncbi:MAG: hypothetical protein V2J55_02970 [Candidatus Competibacteraceae bacterium]|jgi:hypothetical protein|nr:hypothetical protein [Candidatus Competibacteraceae bacterium]